MTPPMLSAALAYAGRGWPVFPCGRDKQPLTAHGFKDASVDANTIKSLWSSRPDAGIGIPTGTPSGFVVLDVDIAHGGTGSLEGLERQYGQLPVTLEAITGGGGRHLFFQARRLDVRNSAGKLGPGLDIRGNGGYIIAPPSLHPSGRRYGWKNHGTPITDMPPWLEKLLVKSPRKAPPRQAGNNGKIHIGERRSVALSLAGGMRREGANEATISAALVAANVNNDPPLPDEELRALARDVDSRYSPAENAAGSRREDTSNAARFVEQYGEITRYAWRPGRWLVWTGTHWQERADGVIVEFAKNVAKQIYNECAALEDEERKKMAQWAERSLFRERIKAMLELAKSDPRIRIENFAEVFDTHPWLINFENGTFDVLEGCLREHRKEDFLTKIIHHSCRPEAECPLWMRFTKATFVDDLALQIQKAVGYSVTGHTRDKAVFLLIGPTNSGKTTFLTVLREIFAPYSAQLQIDTLMHARQEDNNTRADLADLCGARFVITSETEEGHRLREAKLKRITQGMGTIKAVRKYEHPFEFPETHKLWIDCNHHPVVSGSDDAIWDRLVPIPCTHRVPVEQIDHDLKTKLLAEAEGIIAWAIKGAQLWKTEGLGQHEAVTRAREEWRAEMDRVGEWLNDCCSIEPTAWTSSESLYNNYASWAKRQDEAPMAQTSFSSRLFDRGFNKKRPREAGSQKRGFLGLRLRSLGEA